MLASSRLSKVCFCHARGCCSSGSRNKKVLNGMLLHLLCNGFLRLSEKTNQTCKLSMCACQAPWSCSGSSLSGFLGIGFAKLVCLGCFWKRCMTSIDVLNIHDSNTRSRVSDIHIRLEISLRYAAHELSYINATGSKLVCMYTSINIVSLCTSFWWSQKSM